MEAQDVVMHVLHKNVTDEIIIRIRRGPKGYGLLLKLRLLLYAHLKEYFSTRKLKKHLEKYPRILRKLGFQTLPSKRTLDRWKHSGGYELEQIIARTGDTYLKQNKSEWTILDSTPLVDEEDPEATLGYNSQGPFVGFKLHMSCDEKIVPLRACVTHAHVHDSKKAEVLLARTPKTGGDPAYDAKEIKKAVRGIKSRPIFAHNPRRLGRAKKKKSPKMLRKARICIEQCNGFIKSQVMKHAWMLVKGLQAKTVFALTAVLALQGLALYNLTQWGYPSIRIQEVRI